MNFAWLPQVTAIWHQTFLNFSNRKMRKEWELSGAGENAPVVKNLSNISESLDLPARNVRQCPKGSILTYGIREKGLGCFLIRKGCHWTVTKGQRHCSPISVMRFPITPSMLRSISSLKWESIGQQPFLIGSEIINWIPWHRVRGKTTLGWPNSAKGSLGREMWERYESLILKISRVTWKKILPSNLKPLRTSWCS